MSSRSGSSPSTWWTCRWSAPDAGPRPGLAPLAREVQEWRRHDGRADAAATTLDRPFDGQARSEGLVLRRHRGQRDRLLEDRAPAVAGRAPDLASAREHRDG